MKSSADAGLPNLPSAREGEVIFLSKRQLRQYLENYPGRITGPISTYVRVIGYPTSGAHAYAVDYLREAAIQHRASIVVIRSKRGDNFSVRCNNLLAQLPFNFHTPQNYAYDYEAELYRTDNGMLI